MIVRAALALALLASATAARADAPGARPVERYLDALRAQRYDAAFALLTPDERAYFRTARNFASGFVADGYALRAYRIGETRAAGAARVVFVRERVAVTDPANGAAVTTDVTVPYAVFGNDGAARIGDAGRPWRASLVDAAGTAAGVTVRVTKLAYYARAVRVVVQLENTGDGFVTILPYGRSVLRDGERIYRPLETRDPAWTDRRLLLGVRLAPRTRYTGAIAFVTPVLDDRAHRFGLTVGPAVRDGAAAPVSVDVAIDAPRG